MMKKNPSSNKQIATIGKSRVVPGEKTTMNFNYHENLVFDHTCCLTQHRTHWVRFTVCQQACQHHTTHRDGNCLPAPPKDYSDIQNDLCGKEYQDVLSSLELSVKTHHADTEKTPEKVSHLITCSHINGTVNSFLFHTVINRRS